MGILARPRWELVAQGLADGKKEDKACYDAGYKKGCRSDIVCKKSEIQVRLKELQEEMATHLLKSRTELLMELGKVVETGNNTAKIKAINLIAQMTGMLENNVNINVHRQAADLTDDELVAMLEEARVEEKNNGDV